MRGFGLDWCWGVTVTSSTRVGKKKWGNPSFRERDILRHDYIDLKCWQRRYCIFPVILLNTAGQRHTVHFRVMLFNFWRKTPIVIVSFIYYRSGWNKVNIYMFESHRTFKKTKFGGNKIMAAISTESGHPEGLLLFPPSWLGLFCSAWLTKNAGNCMYCFRTMSSV